MFDLKEKPYAVLEFVTIDGYYTDIETKKDRQQVHLNFSTIIEMAAVKIKNGEIKEYFSTFVGIDGCDIHDLKFEEESQELNGITAEHLIGAPSFYDASERLFTFTRGCTLITKYSKNDSRNPLHIINRYMGSAGYIFNNPVISVNNIITAIKIEYNAENDAYNIALSLEDKEGFNDLVAHYLDADAESGRQDSLSRALLTARLIIALLRADNRLNPIDEEATF